MPKRTYRRKARRAPRRKTRTIRKRRVTRRRRPRRSTRSTAMVRAPTPVTSFLSFPSNHRPSGIPNAKRVKLRYAFALTLSKTAGELYATQTFRGNSVYDPDSSGIGHQPRFHDQMSALYNKYVVHGSSINIAYNHPNNANRRYTAILIAQPRSAIIGRVPYYGLTNSELSASTSIGQPYYAVEVPKLKVLNGSNPFYNAPGVLKSSAKTSTILEMKNQAKNLFWGVAGNVGSGTNPTNQWDWTIAVGATDASTAAEDVGSINGYIDYDVTFFEPYATGSS